MKANMQISRLVTAGLKVKTGVLGGKLLSNHARPSLKMETAVKGVVRLLLEHAGDDLSDDVLLVLGEPLPEIPPDSPDVITSRN